MNIQAQIEAIEKRMVNAWNETERQQMRAQIRRLEFKLKDMGEERGGGD